MTATGRIATATQVNPSYLPGDAIPQIFKFQDEYGRFLSVDPYKSSPPNVSIYNSVDVAIQTKIPRKQ